MQEKIIERGMDVVGRIADDGTHVALGDGHAGALIIPQALSIQAAEAQD
jgi:hypothetical protein